MILPMSAVAITVALTGLTLPASAAPMRYDCDTPAGAMSEISQVQSGPKYALRVEVAAKRMRMNREWRPGASFRIRSADEHHEIGVQISAASHRSESLTVSLSAINGEDRRSYPVATVKVGETLRASLDVADGHARADIGGQKVDIPLDLGTGAKLVVTCSTGQFMFEKLDMAAAE
jgi:hypothetical protein